MIEGVFVFGVGLFVVGVWIMCYGVVLLLFVLYGWMCWLIDEYFMVVDIDGLFGDDVFVFLLVCDMFDVIDVFNVSGVFVLF